MAAQDLILFDDRQVAQLEAMLKGSPKAIRRNLAGAVNDTLKEGRTGASRGIRARVAIKKEDVDKYIHVDPARFARATDVAGRLKIKESQRIGLKYFGATQTARGVTYRIAAGGNRKLIPGAFGPPGNLGKRLGKTQGIAKLGKQVFRRAGKARFPLIGPLKGISAWGVFVKAGMDKETVIDLRRRLAVNLQDRINFVTAALAGEIKTPLSKGQMALIGDPGSRGGAGGAG